jgi:CxxC motif-containing protein
VVSATCGIVDGGDESRGAVRSLYAPRRVPVKSAVPCPREKISALLEDIYKTKVKLPVRSGDTIITDWQGSGIDVVAVRPLV